MMASMTRCLLAATATLALSAGFAAAQDGPIKIGASLPLTGNFSVSGTKHQQGYQLCVDEINARGGILGRPLELIISDNRSDPATAIAQYERFINVDEVDAVYGTFSSRLTFPLAAILSKYGYVHPIPAGGALRIYTQGYDNLFYLQPNAAEYIGETLADVIRDLVPEDERPTKAAVVHADDFFANGIAAGLLGQKVTMPGTGDLVADLAPGSLNEAGVEVAFHEVWPEEGFTDWLNLANSIKRSGADLIIGLTASAEEAVQLSRALKTVRTEPKMVYLSQGTQAEYYEGLGASSDGVLVHTSWHAEAPFEGMLGGEPYGNADFVAAFEETFGLPADEDSAIPFAVCQAIEQAMVGTGGTDNAEMGEWLSSRTVEDPVRTILGRFAWEDNGLPKGKAFLMAQWQDDGNLRFVYPTDEFEGVAELVHPKPAW